MATAGKLPGDLFRIFVGAIPIAYGESITLTIDVELLETTTMDDERWTDWILSTRNWTLSIEGIYAFDATYGADDIFDVISAEQELTIEFKTNITGDSVYSGTVLVPNLEISAERTSPANFSTTFQGKGKLTKAVVV